LPCKAVDIVTPEHGKAWMMREFGHDGDVGFRQKHKYARCGVYMVHIALLMIMFGSIATTQSGIDGMMVITEGEGERFVQLKGPRGLTMRHALDFDVACTDFRLKTFVDGTPMAFESDLAILDKQKNILAMQTVRVNEPLQYAGYTFYQASYQPMEGEQLVRVAIAPHNGVHRLHTVAIGTRIEMPDKTSFVPIEIVEDYAGLGAALKVQQNHPDRSTTEFVVFRQYPEFDQFVRRGDWDVFFQGFDQTYATGISVGRVPAISVVFAGFVVMFIGLWMAFCLNYRRYYAKICHSSEGWNPETIDPSLRWGDKSVCTLTFAGASHRYHDKFREEFEKRRIKV
jgi:cytochrome c biogenesis protein